MALKRITDINKFFVLDPKKKTLTFKGKTLQATFPKRYETYGFLNMTDTVQTIGIMDLVIDDEFNARLHLMGIIEMDPSEIETKMINGQEYVVLTFYPGDRFLTNTTIVKNQGIIYAIYTEFIDGGKMIYTMGYDELLWLFDDANEMCDAALPMDHAIFEVIYAHLSRDPDNKFIPFRLTDMKNNASFIPLRSVSYAPDSTTARLMGNHFSDAMLASMLNTVDDRKNIEDLFRGVPTEKSEQKYQEP